jgi:hypothetical protein
MKRRSGVTGGDIKGVSPICKCLIEFCEKRHRKASAFHTVEPDGRWQRGVSRVIGKGLTAGLFMLTLFGDSSAGWWTAPRCEVI